jgi:hypothetical protein
MQVHEYTTKLQKLFQSTIIPKQDMLLGKEAIRTNQQKQIDHVEANRLFDQTILDVLLLFQPKLS